MVVPCTGSLQSAHLEDTWGPHSESRLHPHLSLLSSGGEIYEISSSSLFFHPLPCLYPYSYHLPFLFSSSHFPTSLFSCLLHSVSDIIIIIHYLRCQRHIMIYDTSQENKRSPRKAYHKLRHHRHTQTPTSNTHATITHSHIHTHTHTDTHTQEIWAFMRVLRQFFLSSSPTKI